MSRLPWPSRVEADEGFTIVEVLVALGIIFGTLLVLAFSMLSSFASIGFSRQRTQASALANQTLEQIRALPFDLLFMHQLDVAAGGDPQIQSCSKPSGYCFVATPLREIPVATYASTAPLTPFFNPAYLPPATHNYRLAPDHTTTSVGSPGTTTYTLQSYVTLDPNDSQTKIVNVQVSWSPAQIGGAPSKLQVESKIYTSPFKETPPIGITTTAPPTTTPATTVPGSTTTSTTTPGPLKRYLVNAQSQPGTITVSGTVLNINAANVTFNLPNATSYLSGDTLAGTSTGPTGHLVTGGTASSGVSAAGLSVVNTPSALATASSPVGAATNGPNSNSQTPTILQSIPGSVNQCTLLLVCTLIGGTINGGIAVGQVNSAAAVAASSAAGTANIPTGVIPNNNLGYGRATATQSGALSSNLAINVASVPLLNLGLINLVPTGNTSPDTATTSQNGTTLAPSLQTFAASATKSFTRLDVLTGLPVVGTLLSLTGFSSSASACAGPGTCSAATASEAGTLTVAGIGTPISLSSPGTVAVPNVNVSTGILNIAVTASVTIGSATTTGTGTASVSSPLSVTVHLGISTLLGTVADITIAVNLGSVSTTSSYS